MFKIRNLTESLEKKYTLDEAWEEEFDDEYDDIMADDSLSEQEKAEKVDSLVNTYDEKNESLNEDWMPLNKISRYHNVADEFQVNDKLEIRNTKTGKIRAFTTNRGGQADDKVTVNTKNGKTTSVAKETLKDEIETLKSENLGKSPFTLTDSLNESFVEEWWGQIDEDPFDFAYDYGLTCKKIGKRNDEILYRFTGSKEDIKQAKKDGYFFSLDYNADEGHSEDLNESLNEAQLNENPLIAAAARAAIPAAINVASNAISSAIDAKLNDGNQDLTEDVDMPVDIYEKVFSYVQDRIANDGLSNMCHDVASKISEYNPDWFDEDWILEDEIGNIVDKLAIKVTDQLCGKYYD